MSFTLPIFNCLFNSWRSPDIGVTWTRINTGAQCQLYVNSRVTSSTGQTIDGEETIIHFLRVPKGTDLAEGDVVECEPDEGFCYFVIETERVHKNFVNEYLVGFVNNLDLEFTPLFVMTEGAFEPEPLFAEDGSYIQTEWY